MSVKIESKPDPEAELSNVLRTYRILAPQCSLEKRADAVPQLAPQEKQLSILNNELNDTLLCINLARKGRTAVHDAVVKDEIKKSVTKYEQLQSELQDERSQQTELDCLNQLVQKNIIEMFKTIPTGAEELALIENAQNRLRRMENRLDLATKRFCVVNTENRQVREEIQRLLVERNDFTLQWNRTIGKLVKGKMFLMDIFEMASVAFTAREELCRKLEALKWKGLNQLNRDISEMQAYEGELNHLSKLEEFLRVKGSSRILEADEKEEIKRQEEVKAYEQEIAKHDTLLEEIFEGVILRKKLDGLRQKILDQSDFNEAREERQDKKIAELMKAVEEQRARTQQKQELNNAADATIVNVLKGIDELIKLAKCDCTPLLVLLGNHKDVTRFNVTQFLRILELEVKSFVQVVYSAVKPPAPTPQRKGPPEPSSKLVADPYFKVIKPNRIHQLVSYQPCAYCVEDYIMNLVFETPAVPATREYVEEIFHIEDVNTKFGIYTLTVPAKRHPYRGTKKD